MSLLGNWKRCLCQCHAAPDGLWFATTGVDARDRIEAAACCDRCATTHDVKYEMEKPFRRTKFDPPQDFQPPRPADATGTTEDEDGG